MKKDRSIMGRREFFVTAGVAPTTALASNKLTGLIDPGTANADDSSASASKASGSIIY